MDILLHFLHLGAAATWVGGQIFLVFVFAPVLRGSLSVKERMPLSLAIAHRFKKVGHGALGILLLTGLWRVRYVFLSSAGSFVHTEYGRIFLLKMGLLALSLVLGLLHDKRWGPDLIRLSDAPDAPEFKAATRRMIFWARLNFLATLAIVGCAAGLRYSSF